jgi:hypothetical protein
MGSDDFFGLTTNDFGVISVKKIYLLLAIMVVLNCANFTFAQQNSVVLPMRVQIILNQNYPKWKIVQNACTTATSGDFNEDNNPDYIVLITSKKGGSLVGFVSNGNDFRPVLVKSLDKRDTEISAINFVPKGEDVLIRGNLGNSNAKFAQLNVDGFTLSTCEFDDRVNYIFKNGSFINHSDDFVKNSNQNQNDDEFIVKGSKPWLDTGIDVAEGCTILLSSQGKVDVSSGWGVHDARGTTNFYANFNYPVNANYRYGLAAQITSGANSRDRNRDAWIYEYEGTHFAKKSGRLWLVVNDDNPQDNTGEFRVRVRTNCDE